MENPSPDSQNKRQFPAVYEKAVPIPIGVLAFVILIMLLFAAAVIVGII